MGEPTWCGIKREARDALIRKHDLDLKDRGIYTELLLMAGYDTGVCEVTKEALAEYLGRSKTPRDVGHLSERLDYLHDLGLIDQDFPKGHVGTVIITDYVEVVHCAPKERHAIEAAQAGVLAHRAKKAARAAKRRAKAKAEEVPHPGFNGGVAPEDHTGPNPGCGHDHTGLSEGSEQDPLSTSIWDRPTSSPAARDTAPPADLSFPSDSEAALRTSALIALTRRNLAKGLAARNDFAPSRAAADDRAGDGRGRGTGDADPSSSSPARARVTGRGDEEEVQEKNPHVEREAVDTESRADAEVAAANSRASLGLRREREPRGTGDGGNVTPLPVTGPREVA